MASTLYRNVDAQLRNELDARKDAYGAIDRSQGGHNWVYRKMATAKVSTVDDSIVLAPPAEGGFTDLYKDTTRYVPNPVLTAIAATNEGQLGTLQKATISWSVFSREQLDNYEPFFLTPGKKLKIEFRWSVPADNVESSINTITGIISNFNFSLRNDGGFDCTTEVVSEGFAIMGILVGASIVTEESYIDSNGLERSVNSLRSLIDSNIATLFGENGIGKNKAYVNGFASIIIENVFMGTAQDQKNETNYYVSLERLIDIINDEFVGRLIDDRLEGIRYCTRNIATGELYALGTYDKNVFSANPNEVIFPTIENAKYGNLSLMPRPQNSVEQFDFNNGNNTVDLGKVLLSRELIIDIYDMVTNESMKANINTFLNEIFKAIARNSGGIYELTTAYDSDDTKKILILDVNYTETTGVNPYIFKAFRSDSIVRDVQMGAKLPDYLATSLYTAGRGGAGTGFNNKQLAALVNIADENVSKSNLQIPGDPTQEPNDQDDLNRIKSEMQLAREDLGNNGLTIDTIHVASNALKEYKATADKRWNENILYPIELSIIIDGVNGFKFGHIITTDWLPRKYRLENTTKVVFMITNVSHEIRGNDWITTLQTQCRVT